MQRELTVRHDVLPVVLVDVVPLRVRQLSSEPLFEQLPIAHPSSLTGLEVDADDGVRTGT